GDPGPPGLGYRSLSRECQTNRLVCPANPNAFAIGSQIPITTGERTRFLVGPTTSRPSFARPSVLPSLTNTSEAGLTRSAFWLSLIILSMHSPDPSRDRIHVDRFPGFDP